MVLDELAVSRLSLGGFFTSSVVKSEAGTISFGVPSAILVVVAVVAVSIALIFGSTLLPGLVCSELAVLLVTTEGSLLSFTEIAGLSVVVDVLSLIVLFVEEFFRSAVLVFVVRRAEALHDATSVAALVDVLLQFVVS